LEVVL